MIEHRRVYVIGGDEGPEAEVNEAVLWNGQEGRHADYVAQFDVAELLADALAFHSIQRLAGIKETVVHKEALTRIIAVLDETTVGILPALAALRLALLLPEEEESALPTALHR